MLPLIDPPAGWTVGKSGEKHLETFNADNLFEKIVAKTKRAGTPARLEQSSACR